MKHRKHRWLAGTLAFLLSCSALIPSGNAVFAASKGRIAESETNVTKEEKGDEGEEQITAETLTIEQGETFEIEKDFTGLSLKKGEKAVLKDVVSEDGQGFFADRPGTYLSTYLITPEKGDSYEVTRKIVVKPPVSVCTVWRGKLFYLRSRKHCKPGSEDTDLSVWRAGGQADDKGRRKHHK